jgi:hypothetical protein
MATFQNIIDDARVDLQDSAGTRYTTAQLLGYANDGVREMFRMRPDFRLGSYGVAVPTYVVGDNLPIPDNYRMLLTHYLIFRSETRDDEYAVNGRAASFLMRFEKELKK